MTKEKILYDNGEYDLMTFRKLFLLIKITIIMIITVVLYQSTFVNESDFAHGTLNNRSLADFNFAAAGDWGCDHNSINTVKNILYKNPHLVLGLGDYSYQDKADCWFKLIEPLDHKMKIVIGNHEHQVYENRTNPYPSPSLLQQYMDHFNLSKQYYSFEYQNVHFLAMSTEIPFEPSSDQYEFVESDLKKASTNPNIDWIIVFYHRLAYSSPSVLDSIPQFRNTYHPLFEKYNVDLVMQGHSHNYQRSFPISFNNSTTDEPFVTDNNKNNYLNPAGQIYATVGTGGIPDIHNFTGPPANYTAIQFKAFGFLNIDVINNGTIIEGNFYENDGTIRDHFKIMKLSNNKKENDPSSPSSTSSSSRSEPMLNNGYDDKFKIEPFIKGLRVPSDMTFLGPDDILATERKNGTVQRVVNGQMLGEPLLELNVLNNGQRGLLGIAISKADNATTYVFLYYTEAQDAGSDICPTSDNCIPGTEAISNRLYRYELTKDGTKLINPKLLLDLPATPGPSHNGGKMVIDPNQNIFLIIGDVMQKDMRTQNFRNGTEPDGTGGILKIQLDGNSTDKGPLGDVPPLNMYYAYGIRNGFGLDFDPVTGNLWDTENGPEFGDEMNLVNPGFNSGWKNIQGIWNHKNGKAEKGPLNLDGLEDFNGKGNYSQPEFTWNNTVGPAGIKFFNSDKMGTEYTNTLFVGDMRNGNLYHFKLIDNRTSLLLDGMLADRVAGSPNELEKAIFAEGFRAITDLEVGPDGYLYVLSTGKGAIYRILPK